MMKFLSTTALALGAVLSMNAMAQQADSLIVDDPYVREMPPTAPATGAFMTFINESNQDIIIVRADSDAAKVVELHTHIHDQGVMRMREIPEIVVPAMGQTELKPGGLHIMLINPTRSLAEGDKVAIDLFFKDGSQSQVEAEVRKIMGMGQGRGMKHGHGQGHGMQHGQGQGQGHGHGHGMHR